MSKELNQNINNSIIQLVDIAIKGIEEFYLPDHKIFATKKKMVEDSFILEGKSVRYTLINLIGLHKAQCHGISKKININDILAKQIDEANNYKNIGNIGLLLWATSLIDPLKLNELLSKINFGSILEISKCKKNAKTTELSWFLIGLQFAKTFNTKFKETIGSLNITVYTLLRNNYGGNGIFRHENVNVLKGKIRGKIGNFSDQTYAIFAFTLFSQQEKNEEALQIAKACATKICELQGENGEWNWLYDSEKGNVFSKFPIYSVNQDALAAMSLFQIQRASKVKFEQHIFNGLQWFEKEKENGINVLDDKKNIVWSGISNSNKNNRFLTTLKSVFNKNELKQEQKRILQDNLSYHYGWILYAFAGRLNLFKLQEEKIYETENLNDLKLFNLN